MTITRKVIRLVLLIVILAFTAGCSSMFGDRPPKVVISINASQELNPDISNRPSPLIIRLYQLESEDSFNTARFDDIYDNGKEILGKDLISEREINIFPGDTKVLKDELMTMNSNYIGIVAAYRDIDNAIWRGTIATPINKTTLINVTLGQLSVNVREGK